MVKPDHMNHNKLRRNLISAVIVTITDGYLFTMRLPPQNQSCYPFLKQGTGGVVLLLAFVAYFSMLHSGSWKY